MIAGEAGGDHAAEHEEQHDCDQRDGRHLGALLVVADRARQLGGERLQAGDLDVHAGNVEVTLDGFVVVQDRVVVVALELDRHERVLLACIGHVLEHVRALEVADRPEDLVGVVLFHLGEVVEDLLLELGVVDGLARRCGVNRDDVAGRVAAVHRVGGHGRMHRLAALVVEAALGDVLAQADAERSAAKAQCDHDTDHYVSVSVHRSTPPGEHVNSLRSHKVSRRPRAFQLLNT